VVEVVLDNVFQTLRWYDHSGNVGKEDMSITQYLIAPVVIVGVMLITWWLTRQHDPDNDDVTLYWKGFNVQPDGDVTVEHTRWDKATTTYKGSTARGREPSALYLRSAVPAYPPRRPELPAAPARAFDTPTDPYMRPVTSPSTSRSLLELDDTGEYTLADRREIFDVTQDPLGPTDAEIEEFFYTDPLGASSLPHDLELANFSTDVFVEMMNAGALTPQHLMPKALGWVPWGYAADDADDVDTQTREMPALAELVGAH
jgi:hypothetical protein